MSAIAGVLRFDGAPVDRADVAAITAAMASSGPDGAAYWHMGPIALGHCMLRTTHEAAHEVQPLANESMSVVLVMDGRLDNREELKAAFHSRGRLLRSETDAELVLRAYEVWGEASPHHLLGDFAYAVWDSVRQKLFCAVDQMGACQMHYVKTDRCLAFASTDEALLNVPGVSSAPNEELIANLLVPSFQSFNRERSWINQISMLLAGQRLDAGLDGEYAVDEYWQFGAMDELRFESDADAQAEFLSIFSEAVRCRLRSSGPVSQMLSGGLDSASIRAMAARLLPENACRTYSVISDSVATCKESQCILSLATGARSNFLAVPSFKGVASMSDLMQEAWVRGHPCDNSITLPALMCLAATRDGGRVMLHGASGDLTTRVPLRYPAHLMRQGAWRNAWAECVQASRNNNYLRGSPPASLFLSNAWAAYMPMPIKAVTRRVRTAEFSWSGAAVNEGFARRLRLPERLAQQRADAMRNRTSLPNLRDDQAALLRGPALQSGLAGFARVGRRYGMEMRDPWGDKRVVEFFSRLPLKYKVRCGWTKYLVRSALESALAPEVCWRLGKEHLGAELTWKLMFESRGLIQRLFNGNLDFISEYINADLVRHRVARYLQHAYQKTPQAQDDCQFTYELMGLSLWLQRLSGKVDSALL